MEHVYFKGAQLERAYSGDAAYDLAATEDFALQPLSTITVGTGLFLELPKNVAALVMPRSGLAAKYGVTVLNTPGLIDSGYRGEVKVILFNIGAVGRFSARKGDRIAQLMFIPVIHPVFCRVSELAESDRGEGGLGSSGVL